MALALAAMVILSVLGAGCSVRPALAEEDDAWKFILQRNVEEIQTLSGLVQGLSGHLPDDLKGIKAVILDGEKRLERIKVQESLAGNNPWEARAILRGLAVLEADLARSLKPYTDASAELARQDDHLTATEKDFREQLSDTLAAAEMADALAGYLKSLQDVRGSVRTVKKRLDAGLAPSHALAERLGKIRTRVEGGMSTTLRSFFFAPAPNYFTAQAWKGFHAGSGRWVQSLALSTSSLDREDLAWGAAVAAKVVLLGLVFSLGGFYGLRLLSRRMPGLGDHRPLFRASVWLFAALGLFIASSGYQDERFGILSTLGQIFAARGLLALAWRLRLLGRPGGLAGEDAVPVNLVAPLWGLFSLGLLVQTFSVPGPTHAPFWALILLAATWRLTRLARKLSFDLEQGLNNVARAVLPVLALMAVLGWGHLSVLLTIACFLIAVSVQLGLAVSRLLKAWQAKDIEEGWAALAQGLVYGLGFPMIFLSLLALVVTWLSMHLGGETLLNQVSDMQVGWGELSLNVIRLVIIFVLYFVTRSSVYIAGSILKQLPSRWPEFDRGTVDSLQTVTTYLLWVSFTLVALYLLGVNFTSLAVIAGGLSVGIGFGLQNIVNNFVAGLILLFGRSVQAGDVIELGALSGMVRKVQIRNTIVQTPDNATIFVPNSELIQNHLVNWSHRDVTVRREIVVGVAYGTDTTLVRDLLVQAALGHKFVLKTPRPDVLFKDFGASSLDFSVRFWLDDINHALMATSDIRFAIERIFREHAIEIAFPQQELTLRSAPALERFMEHLSSQGSQGSHPAEPAEGRGDEPARAPALKGSKEAA